MTCNWHNLLPDNDHPNLSHRCLSYRALDRITAVFDQHEVGNQAPFQFVLPILASLYYDINDLLETSDDTCQSDKSLDTSTQEYILSVWHKTIAPPQLFRSIAEDRQKSCQRALRALIYFSWDHERRVFLVRRTYPHYFDFLSYSHCTPGWGSLGEMLQKLEEGVENFEDKIVFTDSTTHPISRQRLLPYRSEVARIRHSAALVLPILEHGRLHGAILFCVEQSADLPEASIRKPLSDSFKYLRLRIAKLLRDEHDRVTIGCLSREAVKNNTHRKSLSQLWREDNKESALLVAELTAYCPMGWTEYQRSELANKLVARLQGPNYFAVLEETDFRAADTPEHQVRILVATPSVDSHKATRKDLFDAAFDVCEQQHYEGAVTFRLSWLSGISPLPFTQVEKFVCDNYKDILAGYDFRQPGAPNRADLERPRLILIALLSKFCILFPFKDLPGLEIAGPIELDSTLGYLDKKLSTDPVLKEELELLSKQLRDQTPVHTDIMTVSPPTRR